LRYGRFFCEPREEFEQCFQGSAANPHYGLGWWLGSTNAPSDLVYASGAGGQALYIVPSQQTVIVHFGESRSYKHDALLKRLFS
jgi:CubicO group peptidase (beta-lactamase class C family)